MAATCTIAAGKEKKAMEIIDAILGLLGVAGGVAGTASAFTGAFETLFGAVGTIIEFVAGFFA